jgi:S-adenosylmethionine:tRNA ribosyltransferase-isomerase
MLTNFHLPCSTLMAMVASRLEGPAGDGVKRLLGAYTGGLAAGYRFYSYGDAMLIA